jgi:uncharacterized protein YjiS (DUF1127 family)
MIIETEERRSKEKDVFKNFLKNRRAIRATENELYRLSDRDLRDLGFSRCDIPRIARDSVIR